MNRKADILPNSLPPRGLSRREAAAYVGVSESTFDAMVGDGRMPTPKRIGARCVWDRAKIDRAFEAIPGDEPLQDDDTWSDVDAA